MDDLDPSTPASASNPIETRNVRFLEKASGLQVNSLEIATIGENNIQNHGIINVNHFHSSSPQQREAPMAPRERKKSLPEQNEHLKIKMDLLESRERDIEERERSIMEKEKHMEATEAMKSAKHQEREEDLARKVCDLKQKEGDLWDEVRGWIQSQGLKIETILLTKVFGLPDAQGVECIVENFDFSQFSCSDLKTGKLKPLFSRLSPLYGKLRISEFKDDVQIGICITLRMLEPLNREKTKAGGELTWQYLSEQLCQAAHLRSCEDPSISFEQVRVVKGVMPDPTLLKKWLEILFESNNVHEATSKILQVPNCGLRSFNGGRTNRHPDNCLIDITFLRFPTAGSQCFNFKLCHVTLHIEQWQARKSFAGLPTGARPVVGLTTGSVSTFVLEEEMIEKMPPKARSDALRDLKDFFGV
ncbi:hypothetical protein EST38_g10833 [Candolleomyces aberdarensis]|uniref:Uncharacterized protein n=1 Tax=Candolleomyces aberdarensis TaxID=2316362 RepID=A0A4Q2D727_9AGAR|nr:hypothetical protein EST38_g10833 [Candolleomyces aberdarensis]